MRVLVAGNSQAGALRLALNEGLMDAEQTIRLGARAAGPSH